MDKQSLPIEILLRNRLISKIPVFLRKDRPKLYGLAVVALGLCAGFFFNRSGLMAWDDEIQYAISQGVLGRYGLGNASFPGGPNQYYATFWEFIIGLGSEYVFAFLHDPFVVRHAMTFALFPLTLYCTYRLLRAASVKTSTALLCTSMLFGIIRFGGHALFNVKDIPAAAFFIISTLWIWVLLHKLVQRDFRWGFVPAVLMGFAAALPFLGRVPLIFHVGLLVPLFLPFVVFGGSFGRNVRSLMAFCIAMVVAVGTIVSFYTPFWTADIAKWTLPFEFFGKFDAAVIDTKVFGMSFRSVDVPLWYSVVWLPIVIEPVTFVAFVFGLLLFCSRRIVKVQAGNSLLLPLGKSAHLDLTLSRWVFFVLVVVSGAILIGEPALYDEERHVLFLYLPLVLLGGLGLDCLRDRAKYILTSLIIISSLFAYLQWGKYSYVYRSPLVGPTNAQQFMGDYWGSCFAEAVEVLPQYAASGAVIVPDVAHSVIDIDKRMDESLLAKDPTFPQYRYAMSIPQGEYIRLAYNRGGDPLNALKDKHRNPVLLWSNAMLGGDTACALIRYSAQ